MLLDLIEKLNKEMKEVKEVEKYVREKLIIEEKGEKKEKKKYTCSREINKNKKVLNLEILMYLIEEKIKFTIKEIQDNLKSNPLVFEASFVINDFDQVSYYYMNAGGIEVIFNLICEILGNKEDTIDVEDNKIIIKIKFRMGKEDKEKELNIPLKNLSLQTTLKNIDQSLKELKFEDINNKKEIKETKEEFKKNLLEKVYPVGSYYWSDKDINPGDIFGGTWNPIKGRFLFSSDSGHSCGSTGGQERVTLKESEIPSHNHIYKKYDIYQTDYFVRRCNGGSLDGYFIVAYKSGNFEKEVYSSSAGGGYSHENMPPYITANCWKRIR